MTDNQFIIDNNALSKLDRRKISSKFFRDHCRIPEEVYFEARWNQNLGVLEDCVYKTTASVLEELTRVLASLPTHDTKLVNLFANQGNADPFVIACAMDGNMALFPEFVVISNDNAVIENAKRFKLKTLSTEAFLTEFADELNN